MRLNIESEIYKGIEEKSVCLFPDCSNSAETKLPEQEVLPVSAQISQTQSGAERQPNLTTWKKEESVKSISPFQPSYPSTVMQKGKKKKEKGTDDR